MYFRQYELGCLSLYSYLIGDETTGRAVVVDPQRDIAEYVADAEAQRLRIERVIETHFHADFLSGHLELAAATGATVCYGEGARADFPLEELADGSRITLGHVELEIRATPGHTPESIAIVVYPQRGEEPWGVLTGDTLFIGDVGRPDLLSSIGWNAEDLARRLFRSLHDKLLTLPDATLVFPAHGAGSACGKSLSAASQSTIGQERATNYALQPTTEDAFVDVVLQGQSVAPLYFPFAADANRRQHDLLNETEPIAPIDFATLLEAEREGAVLIDTRAPDVFASGYLRGAVNVSLDGRFAEYAGDVARPGQPIVLAADAGRASEARVRLARIGFDDVRGAVVEIERVLAAHPELAEIASRLPAAGVADWLEHEDVQVVDVRNPGEQAAGIVPGATLVPLATLLDRMVELDAWRPTIVYCAGGYRSSIAASLLRAHGFRHVADMLGGFDAWRAAALPVEKPRVVDNPA